MLRYVTRVILNTKDFFVLFVFIGDFVWQHYFYKISDILVRQRFSTNINEIKTKMFLTTISLSIIVFVKFVNYFLFIFSKYHILEQKL